MLLTALAFLAVPLPFKHLTLFLFLLYPLCFHEAFYSDTKNYFHSFTCYASKKRSIQTPRRPFTIPHAVLPKSILFQALLLPAVLLRTVSFRRQ
jgi:hypothetical protein